MNRSDLDELDRLLRSASAVVSMREVHAGAHAEDVIGLRHDVDDNRGSLDTALKMAVWEHGRGYRSTYFILHTASYWERPDFWRTLNGITAADHEIGIHANAIAHALRNGGDPAEILNTAIDRLRSRGFQITGVAPHGDAACRAGGKLLFVNDEMFSECPRPLVGPPNRELRLGDRTLQLDPRPLADFGLEYESYRLPHGRYVSDSGDRWSQPLASASTGAGQLHILQHPDWWGEVFT